MSDFIRVDFVGELSRALGIDESEADKTLQAFLDGVAELTNMGERVRVPCMGTFEVKERSWNARDIKACKPVPVEKRRFLTCSFVCGFKQRVGTSL